MKATSVDRTRTRSRQWRTTALTLGALASSLLALGCGTGYVRPSTLERTERGPAHCSSYCEDLGLKMGALVAVGREVPACVCVPEDDAADAGSQASAAVAGAAVMMARQQHRQEQRRQATPTGR